MLARPQQPLSPSSADVSQHVFMNLPPMNGFRPFPEVAELSLGEPCPGVELRDLLVARKVALLCLASAGRPLSAHLGVAVGLGPLRFSPLKLWCPGSLDPSCVARLCKWRAL